MASSDANRVDIAVGVLLGVAALAFGGAGFFAGLTDKRHADQWDLAALLLALTAGAVAFDELLVRRQALAAVVSTILRVSALALGGIGFVLGLSDAGHDLAWQVGAIVLAILALTAKTDSLRRQVGGRWADGFAELAAGFGLLAIALTVYGFRLGLSGSLHSASWLYSGVICAVIALSCAIAAENRDLSRRKEAEQGATSSHPGTDSPDSLLLRHE